MESLVSVTVREMTMVVALVLWAEGHWVVFQRSVCRITVHLS